MAEVVKIDSGQHPNEVATSKDILEKIRNILLEHDNKESDIPVTHMYWNLLNQYRRLRSQENAN